MLIKLTLLKFTDEPMGVHEIDFGNESAKCVFKLIYNGNFNKIEHKLLFYSLITLKWEIIILTKYGYKILNRYFT